MFAVEGDEDVRAAADASVPEIASQSRHAILENCSTESSGVGGVDEFIRSYTSKIIGHSQYHEHPFPHLTSIMHAKHLWNESKYFLLTIYNIA